MKPAKCLSCLLAVVLTGCSTAAPVNPSTQSKPAAISASSGSLQKESPSTQSESKVAATSTVPNSSSAAQSVDTASGNDLKTSADQLRKYLSDAGFQIVDDEKEVNEISFDAYGSYGEVGVEIQWSTDPGTAYTWEINDNDVSLQDEYTNNVKKVAVLKDLEDQDYQIVAMAEREGLIYEFSDVREGDLPTLLSILGQLEFPGA